MKTVVVHAQQRWEHKIVTRRSDTALMDEANNIGQDGWEMVTVLYYKDMKGVMAWTAFFKRPGTGEPPKPAAAAPAAAAAPKEEPATTAGQYNPADWPGLDVEGGTLEILEE